MRAVVERCPSCGVEHDDYAADGCEACGTALRYWCRAHSREVGWLETPECRRCAEEAARPAPPPRPRAAPSATRPAPAPGRPPAASHRPKPPPAPAPRRKAARAEDAARTPGDTPQTVLGNIILVLLAAGVAGGLLAWGEAHPEEAFAVGVGLAVIGMTAAMLFVAVRFLGRGR